MADPVNKCPHCGRVVAVLVHGRMSVHGPLDARCPGSHQPAEHTDPAAWDLPPAGHQWVWVPSGSWRTLAADEPSHPCRFGSGPRKRACGAPPVAYILRSHGRASRRWCYCLAHVEAYGNRIQDGVVVHREARPEFPPDLRVAIDAYCPGCGYPERAYTPATGVFSCSSLNREQCDYTSRERES